MSSTDAVTVTTVVEVAPELAFEVFTDEVDRWWRTGPRYRFDPLRTGEMRFEGGARGRLVEVYDEAAGDVYEVGRVRAWEPGRRLVFDFRPRALERGETTVVEVRFEPHERGTRVTLVHRGWDGLPPDHPVRHGVPRPAFGEMMGRWWSELFTALAARARSDSTQA